MWVHGAATVLEATFAHSLNMIGTSVLVVEMGVVKEELYSECDGILFTLREYPVVSEGSLIGRILERQA